MSNNNLSQAEKQRIFQNKNYVLLVLANTVNRFGDSVDSIVFTWLTYSLTGSADHRYAWQCRKSLPEKRSVTVQRSEQS